MLATIFMKPTGVDERDTMGAEEILYLENLEHSLPPARLEISVNSNPVKEIVEGLTIVNVGHARDRDHCAATL